MTAIPLARFLVEFGTDSDRNADGSHPDARTEASWMANSKARLAESRAQGHAEGKAEAQAEFDARLEAQQKDFERQLAMARQIWVAAEGNALSAAFLQALQELETRLAETAARILQPFLEAEVRRAAIAELMTTIDAVLARDEAARIDISGPDDLLGTLRARLGDKVAATFSCSETCDVRVTIGYTTLETRLGAWIAAIGEGAR